MLEHSEQKAVSVPGRLFSDRTTRVQYRTRTGGGADDLRVTLANLAKESWVDTRSGSQLDERPSSTWRLALALDVSSIEPRTSCSSFVRLR